MTNISLIRSSLKKLCDNSYTSHDVLIIVNHLRSECQKLLNITGATNYINNNDYGDLQKKLNDYSIDIIAPLFARNEFGEFIIIKKQFEEVIEDDYEKIEKAVMQLLNLAVKQGMIRFYEETDPIGKVFYRSIRYILVKRTDWEKSELNARRPSINKAGFSYPPATMEEIEQTFLYTPQKSPTKQLKMVLADLIDHKKLSVPFSYLLTAFRDNIKYNNEIIFDTIEHSDENESIDYTIDQCIRQIDSQILSNYETNKKLSQKERVGFRLAIKDYLSDLVHNGGADQYFSYLSRDIGFSLSYEVYLKKYKSQFEYVAKKSKEIFSAMVKNVNYNK